MTGTARPGGLEPFKKLAGLLDDHDAEASASTVAVLSYRYWQRHYGGDRAVIGRRIHLNERSVQVVGIAPATFNGLSDQRPSLFLPVTKHPDVFAGSRILADFSDRGTLMYAKLKASVSVRVEEAELGSLTAELKGQHPDQIKSQDTPVVRASLPVEAASALALVTVPRSRHSTSGPSASG
jgi:putative ABC transport system permease protein